MEFVTIRSSLLFKILFFLFCSISILASSASHAAKRVSLQHLTVNELQRWLPLPFLQSGPKTLIVPTAQLSLIERHTDMLHIEHVRMQQHYQGIPVFGGHAIFHHNTSVSALSAAVTMNGALYQHLQKDLGTQPSGFLSGAQTALNHYSQQFSPAHIAASEVMPLIYVDEQQQAYWAYRVRVFLQPMDGSPSQPTAIVAAQDGRVLVHWDDLQTLREMVHGLGFGGNRKIGKYQFGKEFPFLNLIRDDELGQCFLENSQVRIVDMGHHTQHVNRPMSFDCEETLLNNEYWTGYEEDGYDQINGGYSVANDAMYMGGVVKDMYQKRYHQEVLYSGHKPMQLVLRIHYSTHFANAFWDGRQMTFGDGDGEFHPMVSLGITAHEISHGFTEQHSGLVYYGQAGGMNESFSDMAAQAAEYYVHGQSSWLIGADILKGRGALRFLSRPSRDGLSIDRADQYQVGMDVHYSSGVYNHLFYVLSHRPGWDPSKAFEVMLKANMDYWTPTSTFAEGACGLLAASNDLGFDDNDVMIALDDVMIDYGEC